MHLRRSKLRSFRFRLQLTLCRKLHTASLLLLSKFQTLCWFEIWFIRPLPNWWAKVDSHYIAIMLRCAPRNRSAKEAFPLCPLVGQSGLEPPTSRLSVVCSSQLSYWPIWWRLAGSLFCFKSRGSSQVLVLPANIHFGGD